MTLKPALDPFPTTEVFRMGDECLDDHYRLVPQDHGTYRASHVLEDWVLLTWIWVVPPVCLGSR